MRATFCSSIDILHTNVSLTVLIFFSDLCTELGSKRGFGNLQISGARKGSFLRVWRLYNGRTCIPDFEGHYTKIWGHE